MTENILVALDIEALPGEPIRGLVERVGDIFNTADIRGTFLAFKARIRGVAVQRADETHAVLQMNMEASKLAVAAIDQLRAERAECLAMVEKLLPDVGNGNANADAEENARAAEALLKRMVG